MASSGHFLSKSRRMGIVIAIASTFLIVEVAVGFLTKSLALVADAFHIFSDLIGYVVALLAIRYASRPNVRSEQYTYGYRRAELLGGFFNGAFLMALGVSILLQSIERFIEPKEIERPVLVMAVGAGGIGSNIIMLLFLGGHDHHGHSHSDTHDDTTDPSDAHHEHDHSHSHAHSSHIEMTRTSHDGHAHSRVKDKKSSRLHDMNILGVLIHIIGDALNSVAVIISAGIYLATGFIYADPIASVVVAFMIMGTSWPLLSRSGKSLLGAAPEDVDIKGVREDIERVSGKGSVHDLHVWTVDGKSLVASLHLATGDDSLNGFDTVSDNIRKCLHLWGIHDVTIQPELPPYQEIPADQSVSNVVTAASDDALGHVMKCRKLCAPTCQEVRPV